MRKRIVALAVIASVVLACVAYARPTTVIGKCTATPMAISSAVIFQQQSVITGLTRTAELTTLTSPTNATISTWHSVATVVQVPGGYLLRHNVGTYVQCNFGEVIHFRTSNDMVKPTAWARHVLNEYTMVT